MTGYGSLPPRCSTSCTSESCNTDQHLARIAWPCQTHVEPVWQTLFTLSLVLRFCGCGCPHVDTLAARSTVVTAVTRRMASDHDSVPRHSPSSRRATGMRRDDGVGLAAPQVGVNVRLMVFNPAGRRGEGEELVLVNPRIVSTSKGRELAEEGCLSFHRLGTKDLIRADVEVCGARC